MGFVMAKAKDKPIHLIQQWAYNSKATCDYYFSVVPIEATNIGGGIRPLLSKGTFDPTKVTCKRCLKHPLYKEAIDKIDYPLLFWKENT